MSQFLSLPEYLKYAEIVLRKWAIPDMSKDEDCIADIAHALMKADERFNGCGDRTKYMLWCGRLHIKRLMSKWKKRRKFSKLNKNIPSNAMHHEDRLDLENFLDTATEKRVISNEQHYCLISNYIYGKTLAEIGKELNITKQAVSLQVKNAIDKLKKFHENSKI